VILGDNFGNQQSKVSVAIAGGKACTVTNLVDHHTVECTTPEYTGWATSSVVVTAGGQSSSSAFSIKYRGELAVEVPCHHSRRGPLTQRPAATLCLRSTLDWLCRLQRRLQHDRSDAGCCWQRLRQHGGFSRSVQSWIRVGEPRIMHAYRSHPAVMHGDGG
jgi:hypothetical protein